VRPLAETNIDRGYRSRLTDGQPPSAKVERMMARVIIYLVFVVPTIAIGGFMMLRSLGAFGTIETTPDGPAWLGVIMGFVFFAGGVAVVIKMFYLPDAMAQSELPAEAPWPVRLFYNGLGVGIVAGLGALFGWIAFGPGERHFSGSGAFLGATVGRVMFGLVAALAGLMLVLMVVRWFKRQR
jgi:hypothetical protein